MKSNGCRDVQHTGLQIKAHKQEGTLVSKGHSAHLPKHLYTSDSVAA